MNLLRGLCGYQKNHREKAENEPSPFIQIVDSVPLPVCHYVRAGRCRSICGEAAFGVCESKKEKVYGFKMILQHQTKEFLYHFQ
ncbi:MAG: hypothetical protein V2A53_01040 [bacterium]